MTKDHKSFFGANVSLHPAFEVDCSRRYQDKQPNLKMKTTALFRKNGSHKVTMITIHFT